MKIAVLSGKGGTGKTFISVNLAAVAKDSKYVDCDVEEPNGHLFFKPVDIVTEEVKVMIPQVDEELCNGCRTCIDFCRFNALAHTGKKLIIFEDICHACGGCVLFCPQKALSEKDKTIGRIRQGYSQDVTVLSGILDIGEVTGVPIIDQLLEKVKMDDGVQIIDCPPGSSCTVMESIEDADYCILVAEPTTFGVHNLNMVYKLVKLFDKAHGVVLNKCLDGENPAQEFCKENNIEILEKIYFDKELGELNSNGFIASRESEKYKEIFSTLLENVAKEVENERTINP